MLWKIIAAWLAVLARPFQGPPLNEPPYEASPYGPQSWRESHEAMQALHGEGGDMRFPEDWPEGTGIKHERFRWPGYPGSAKVPIVIDDSLYRNHKQVFDQCIAQYHKNTCVRFVRRTNERDYIRIIKGRGCYSWVGRQGGAQELSLGDGCWFVGTICHELGHALGFFHEHQRSDRDNYINVYYQNVIENQKHNFNKTAKSEEFENPLPPYDYDSMMHYGEYAFSRSPNRLKTMEAKDGRHVLKEPFQKPGLNQNDIRMVNRLYKCRH